MQSNFICLLIIISSTFSFLVPFSSEALELTSQLQEDLPILGDLDLRVAHNTTCEPPPVSGYLELIYGFLAQFFQTNATSDRNLTESQRSDFELYDFDPVRIPGPPHLNASDEGSGGQTFETRIRSASSTHSVLDLLDPADDPTFKLLPAGGPDIDNVTVKVPVNQTDPRGEGVDPFVGVIEDTSGVFTRFSLWLDHSLEAHPYLTLGLAGAFFLVCYIWLCWLSTHYLLSTSTRASEVENPPPVGGNGGNALPAGGADPQPQPQAAPDHQPPDEVDHMPGPDAGAMPLHNLARSAPSLRILDEAGAGQALPPPSAISSTPSTPSSHTYVSIPSFTPPSSPIGPSRQLGAFNGHRPRSLELTTNYSGPNQFSTSVRCTAV